MKNCPITLWPTINYKASPNITYSVKVLGEEYRFRFCVDCFNGIDFHKYGIDIYGLILNGKLDPKQHQIHWESNKENEFDLKSYLQEANYPKTPKEKLDNLLIELSKFQEEIGKPINFEGTDLLLFSSKCYLRNNGEFIAYMDSLNDQGLIIYHDNRHIDHPFNVRITFKGFNYLAQLEDSGADSKNCFIAMAFDKRTEKIRDSIKKAILNTGFNPIIIDEEHIDSDQTINDAIIAGIKKSKFCISDFTLHRNGVYFESGFALGLGRPVIYCCEETEFKNAHFDIKPLQHIIYKTEDELEKRLIDKIEAWIK